MDAVRDYGLGHQVTPVPPPDQTKIVDEHVYQAGIRERLAQEKFDELEKSAR